MKNVPLAADLDNAVLMIKAVNKTCCCSPSDPLGKHGGWFPKVEKTEEARKIAKKIFDKENRTKCVPHPWGQEKKPTEHKDPGANHGHSVAKTSGVSKDDVAGSNAGRTRTGG